MGTFVKEKADRNADLDIVDGQASKAYMKEIDEYAAIVRSHCMYVYVY